MNIGTQTNSLINNLYSRMTVNVPAPTVGMAATTLSWTDRHAATVTKVSALSSEVYSHEIEVIDDKIIVISGSTHDGSAKFETVQNPEGHADIYRLERKTGKWVHGHISRNTRRFLKMPGGLILGRRDHYVDPSF